jgi:ribosomal protein L39E
MLTGKLPYGEISAERAAKKKFNYIPARQYNSTIPDWMDVCLQKAVNPNPAKRYELLSEFISDFSKPNQSLLDRNMSQPLLERNPLGFWRGVAFIQFTIIILLLFYFLR